MKKRSVKTKNVKHQLDEIDLQRIQAVLKGELDPKWVSDAEVLAVRDRVYDTVVGKLQTHYGVYTIQ